MTKRLFLFAGYDRDNRIDASLVYMLNQISKNGDIIFVMDCDCPDTELDKIRPVCLYTTAQKHGEYDFGSYRRAYTYARDTAILSDYDFIYLINDSVYGPLYDMTPIFSKMESMNWDGFGLVKKPHHDHPHIQSWFIGMNKSVFLSTWFDEFITSITKQPSKGVITHLYEHGFSKKLTEHGHTWGTLYECPGRSIYNNIKKLYLAGMPFMKKMSVRRRHGALGGQLDYVLRHIPNDARNAIMENMCRIYGNEYIHWLLTKNPIKIILRNIHHSMYKIFIEGI